MPRIPTGTLIPGIGQVVTEKFIRLTANITTIANPLIPTFDTLLAVTIVKKFSADQTVLRVTFACAALYTGAPAGVAGTFQCRIDGADEPAEGFGTTTNYPAPSTIMPSNLLIPEIPGIDAGSRLVEIEWARYGPVGRTLSIAAFSLPFLQNAGLLVQEVVP